MLRELAELGMALARQAAQQAMAASGGEPEADAPPETAAGTPGGSARGEPRLDPNQTFERLSRAVRQTIALEARIAAGLTEPRQRRAHERACEPRLHGIRDVLRSAADAEPPAARRALYAEIDDRLAPYADCEPGELRVMPIVSRICADLGIRLDHERMSDELIEICVGRRSPATDDRHGTAPASLQPQGPDPP